MKIKIKGRYSKGTEFSSGIDLYSDEDCNILSLSTKVISTGVAVELPHPIDAQIRPRSSMSKKGILTHFGTIDNDYRGVLGVCLTNLSPMMIRIQKGDRIAQLVFSRLVEHIELEPVTDISTETIRGAGGWGSTGQ